MSTKYNNNIPTEPEMDEEEIYGNAPRGCLIGLLISFTFFAFIMAAVYFKEILMLCFG